jgi:hypothetical protein
MHEYECEHGDVHDYHECECDRDGELHGADDYRDYSNAGDTSNRWDVATVYGDCHRDGGVHERGDVVSDAADGKSVERWNDHVDRPLSDAISSPGYGFRNGNEHV